MVSRSKVVDHSVEKWENIFGLDTLAHRSLQVSVHNGHIIMVTTTQNRHETAQIKFVLIDSF